jgi:hypothetical protein
VYVRECVCVRERARIHIYRVCRVRQTVTLSAFKRVEKNQCLTVYSHPVSGTNEDVYCQEVFFNRILGVF